MADKTGEQRRAHEGDDTGSQRSGLETQSRAQVRSFFFTLLTFITYKLRHTCHCYHCTPPPPSPPCQSRRRPHDASKRVHTKGQRRPTKAHEGQHRPTVTNSQCRPTAANDGCYQPLCIQTYPETRVRLLVHAFPIYSIYPSFISFVIIFHVIYTFIAYFVFPLSSLNLFSCLPMHC